MLQQLAQCLGRRRIRLPATAQDYPSEKAVVTHKSAQPEMSAKRVEEIALSITDVMMDSTKPVQALRVKVNDLVHAEGGWWSEALATRILELATKIVKAEAPPLGSTMTAAYHRAMDEASKILELAGDFAHEHPVLTAVACVIVALGILYLLCPWVIEALGFCELGPLEGSWAARWQSMYGGRVPIGSVFSYLQRLGMTWRGNVMVLSKL